MKKKVKKFLCSVLAAGMLLSAASITSAISVFAKESVGNGLILSADAIALTEGEAVDFTAVLGEGLDASRLACVVADPFVAAVTPVAVAANAAAFRVSYKSPGTTVVAIYHADNPAVVAYTAIVAQTAASAPLAVEYPAKLGTNRDNYCRVVSYEIVPYDFTYLDFRDYKQTLKLEYQCVSYKDEDFTKWGCYGYFYDADGNVLSKVHLYCGTLSKGRLYSSEFHVPLNAVRFSIEGFN